ncbi:MAG: sulfite exporter TauE/SafE family protein [Nitrosomonadales bacterium]|nr:sulfite exporter TauE/SafE family protein [Nitrosomonadales bacterium]
MDAYLVVSLAFFLVALLYAIVGHAGGSGYIAVMVLAGMALGDIRPTALSLNVLVASIATFQFVRAGHFSMRLFLPFMLGSIPMAYLGGTLQLSATPFKILLGIALLFSAWRLIARRIEPAGHRELPVFPAVAAGGVIGLLSGLLGIGGGIFLTPLLLLTGWAVPRQAAAVSAPFILFNSLFALVGFGMHNDIVLPDHFAGYAAAVVAGGLIGAYLGSHRLQSRTIVLVLSAVLLVAGGKMLYV